MSIVRCEHLQIFSSSPFKNNLAIELFYHADCKYFLLKSNVLFPFKGSRSKPLFDGNRVPTNHFHYIEKRTRQIVLSITQVLSCTYVCYRLQQYRLVFTDTIRPKMFTVTQSSENYDLFYLVSLNILIYLPTYHQPTNYPKEIFIPRFQTLVCPTKIGSWQSSSFPKIFSDLN